MQKNEMKIVSESEWLLNDDNVSEYKNLIGLSKDGYHFGHIDGFPESEYFWSEDFFASAKQAELERTIDIEKFEQQCSEENVVDLTSF